MHVPKHFEVTDQEELLAFIEANPFGMLVTQGAEGILADHVPLLLHEGHLYGHINRSNPNAARLDGEGMAVFTGPQGYVSTQWYPSGFRFPTWNFQVVHVYGRLRRLSEQANLANIERLVRRFEPRENELFAMEAFEKMASGTAGFALSIDRIKAMFKLSQNKEPLDFEAIVAGFRGTGQAEMADAMEKWRPR